VAPRVWLARDTDLDRVAALIAEFRDWWGKSEPSDATIRRTAGALLEDSGSS
jgi:hypothetical protein